MDNRGGGGSASLLLAMATVVLLTLSLGACNTMSGFGEDVEAAGRTMSDTAEDVQD